MSISWSPTRLHGCVPFSLPACGRMRGGQTPVAGHKVSQPRQDSVGHQDPKGGGGQRNIGTLAPQEGRKLLLLSPVTISDNCHSGSGGVVIVIVIVAELESGGSSVAMVGESPTTTSPKIIARSEAKHIKRSVFITLPSIPQQPLDNHNPPNYNSPDAPFGSTHSGGVRHCRL